MPNGTRLAHLKILEGDCVSKKKASKNQKLASSSSNKKIENIGKKVTDPVTGSGRKESSTSPSMCTVSKKSASSIIRQKRKEDGMTRSSSTSDKSNKNAITLSKRKKQDGRTVSSSSNNSFRTATLQVKKSKVDDLNISSRSNNSIGSASPQNKKRKIDDLHRSSQFTTSKNEENDKKIVRKLLHVRKYKRLLTKGAKKVGGQDDRKTCFKEKRPTQRVLPSLRKGVSKEAHEDVVLGNLTEDLQEKRELKVETNKPLEKEELNNMHLLAGTMDANFALGGVNQEYLSTFGGYKGGRAVNNLKSDVLPKQSGKEMSTHTGSQTNTKPSLARQEVGVRDNVLSEAECCGTITQQISEKNASDGPKKCTTTCQIVSALPDLCLACEQPGPLMCCGGKGCKQSYHLSCLDPPLNDIPYGVWLCNDCVEKRMKSGIYSVSEGIESVWDVDEGTQSGKHYFVKYKGLSHVHNLWVSESELLLEAPPSLFAKIRKMNQKEKVKKWRKEWAEPERLLQNRVLAASKVADKSKSAASSFHFCVEWLVKWKGLGYDQATWEVENLLLSYSPEAVKLIEDYKHRREQAKRSYDPLIADQALQVKKVDLSELPAGCPVELDMDHLNSVNRLREFWYKSQNAVLIDDQDRISKSVLFALSLQSNAYSRPSLIITTSGSIPLWEAEFVRLAPSLCVIKYLGNKDIRKMIQKLEFYEESGCVMLQILLSDPDVIIEDLGDLACIGWETVIVDECQNSKTSSYLEQFKSLTADFKLLLFNGQLKGSLSQFLNFLSFIGAGAQDNGPGISNLDNNENTDVVGNLREKLMCHVAYERKVESSKFLEYWVPVPLSNVQLEAYCNSLISNFDVLRSNSRSDLVGAIHDIVISTKMCCDHPYLVDGELRNSLTKGLQGVDFFNAEVHASGKLFLLEKILQELKSHGMRVVIIFQSAGGPGRIFLGDILDDFLRQRFGVDSYERIETRLMMSKKLTAQNMFNDRKMGRFVFLIESRACLPSVKLCFVDVVILFNSDWNPFNDLRGLQKITFQPQSNCMRVFRFYTSFTVEEKLLKLAKHDTPLESNIQSTSRNVILSLLVWGASNLFRKLDLFHSTARTTCISETSSDMNLLNDVISEILDELLGETQTNRTVPCFLKKVSRSGASYSKDTVLVGEKEDVLVPDKDFPSFWSSLLEGKHPKWLYISKPSQRFRRKNNNLDESRNLHEAENDEVKQRRKSNSTGEPFTSIKWSQERRDAVKEPHKSHLLESQAGEPKLEEQRTLLMLLRPELAILCDILNLPDSVNSMAQEFLEYIMNNHDVSSKQVTVLQALKISLCWRAAYMLGHNFDRLESLGLARRYLDYECTEEEAFSVYSKLRILKEKFPCQTVVLKDVNLQNSFADVEKDALPGRITEIGTSDTSMDGAPAGNSTESDERCPIQSNTESMIVETEALLSQSGTLDMLATTEQNQTVEQSGTLPGLTGALPMDRVVPAHQPEFSNQLSGAPDDLIPDLITLKYKDVENGGPTIAASSRNNLELTSSEVTIPVSQSVTLSLQDESRCHNGAIVLESAHHLLPQAEQDGVMAAGNTEELACSRVHCSSQQNEVLEQQEILASAVENEQSNEQIPENTLHPLSSMEDAPPERLSSENLRSTGIPSDTQNQSLQNLPSMDWVPPQAIYADPFHNELYRIRKQYDSCTRKFEDKKIRLQLECEEEIVKVRRKYDALLHDAERECLHEKRILMPIYNKVLLHKVLADELRGGFFYNKGASVSFQGSNQNLIRQLQASASSSHPQPHLWPSATPPLVSSATTTHPTVLTTNQPSTSSFLSASRPSNPSPAVASFQSAGPSCQGSSLLSSNIVRGSTPILPVGRAPAPHLQRFRLHSAIPVSNSPLSAVGPVTSPVPLIPSPNMVSTLPAAFPPMQPSFAQFQLPAGADLLESLPLNLPSMGNEIPASNMFNSRTITSSDLIYLSDNE